MLKRRTNKQFNKNRGFKCSGKPYSNPFFNKKRQRPGRSYGFPIKIILFASIIIFFALAYLFFFSDYFKIKNTEISGEGGIDKSVIEYAVSEQANSRRYAIFSQNNIFIFDKQALAGKLGEKYSFDFLNIKKDLPNKIIIEYREKEYSVIWTEDEKYYYVDKEGYVISETNVLEIGGKNYPIIENKNSSKIYNNKVPADQIYIGYIINLYNSFKNEKELKIEKFVIDSDLNAVKIKLINGPYILFNSSESIEKQTSKLQIIKNEKIKDDFFKKEYIDVRYGDSVYYR